jgi:hypothetical protein
MTVLIYVDTSKVGDTRAKAWAFEYEVVGPPIGT